MHYHCLEPIHDSLFAMDIELQSYIYEFEKSAWLTTSSTFPCDHIKQTKVMCKPYDYELIIVPSVKNELPCTGIFNITSKTWSEMEKDDRNAPYDGFLQHLPNSDNKEILLYFGGYQNGGEVKDALIWKFLKSEYRWEKFPVSLPNYLQQNATVMTLVHPDLCEG